MLKLFYTVIALSIFCLTTLATTQDASARSGRGLSIGTSLGMSPGARLQYRSHKSEKFFGRSADTKPSNPGKNNSCAGINIANIIEGDSTFRSTSREINVFIDGAIIQEGCESR